MLADVMDGRTGGEEDDGNARAVEGDLAPLDAPGVRDVRPPDRDGVPVGDEQAKAKRG